jgi:hypothetical protein
MHDGQKYLEYLCLEWPLFRYSAGLIPKSRCFRKSQWVALRLSPITSSTKETTSSSSCSIPLDTMTPRHLKPCRWQGCHQSSSSFRSSRHSGLAVCSHHSHFQHYVKLPETLGVGFHNCLLQMRQLQVDQSSCCHDPFCSIG